MTGWHRICGLDEIVEERGAACLVDGRQVAIFRVRSDIILAVSNWDPFSRANVISRGIVGSQADRWFVASPMYKHRFDLETGLAHDDASVALDVFSTRVDQGIVYVAAPEA